MEGTIPGMSVAQSHVDHCGEEVLHLYGCMCNCVHTQCVPPRRSKGRVVYLQGAPNTGKSTIAKMFRSAALVSGNTTCKFPRDTAAFGKFYINK